MKKTDHPSSFFFISRSTPSDFDFNGLKKLPAQHQGRLKPLDSVARTSLLILRENQSLTHEGRSLSPIEWLATLTMDARKGDTLKMIRIDNPDVLPLINKQAEDGKYYSYGELEVHRTTLPNVYRRPPPVTNLYSSAVFVGWGSVSLGIILERLYRNGIGSCVASITGSLSLIVAHHLMNKGDTMEMMRAVLNSNFWLSTHVVTISMGYSSALLAGFLACAYVIRGLFPQVDKSTQRSIYSMVYGIICFSTFFSFVGTILGGIWADQSWGRFWGWDPKENGALMIVLWNAIILHARWGNLIKAQGVMYLAIFGNVICSFSWFGVNMLGVGLHSYGFMQSALFWLSAFMLSQIAVILIGASKKAYDEWVAV
ncbi:MAG: ABC-type transport system involved in cytochrome c biogenesis permease subunit [Halioglobus sp.]|jgi:ABC-type transport system involved in cytochrome c biogenesis permease subunit